MKNIASYQSIIRLVEGLNLCLTNTDYNAGLISLMIQVACQAPRLQEIAFYGNSIEVLRSLAMS